MKKILPIVLLIICAFANAQTVTYQDIVDQKSAKELTGKNMGGNITEYIASDGVSYKVGSKITYGYPSNGKYYLYFTDVSGGFINAFIEDESETRSERAANSERSERVANRAGGAATIKKIQCLPIDVFNKKFSGCKIYLVLNRGGIACTNFEEAIAIGEIATKMKPSDAALQELKKWKEKLDLQIITQEEYDAKKAELMKFIE